jgi:predicted adenylyl cyclase CyaB
MNHLDGLAAMKRNVEIKARIKSIDSLLPAVAAIATHGPTEIFQDDTFFSCPRGRLKLRAFSESEGELIFYQRPDIAGPKESSYIIAATASPGELCRVLSRAYGQLGHVRKQRALFLVGTTRIHLDRVEKLGEFLEIEVVLDQNESVKAGLSHAEELMNKLGIARNQLTEESYVDLLSKAVR